MLRPLSPRAQGSLGRRLGHVLYAEKAQGQDISPFHSRSGDNFYTIKCQAERRQYEEVLGTPWQL
jgi:hypothetical protein